MVGKRVTSDVAKEVMTLMGHIVDCQNAIIHRCLKACEALRDQIDAKYAQLKEEKEQYNRHWGEETVKAWDRFEAVPDKEEPDPALVSEKEALEKAIEEKRVPYEAAQERYGRAQAAFLEVIKRSDDIYWAAKRKRDDAKAALDAAQAAFDAAVQKRNDFLDGIYNDLKAKQDAFVAKYEQAMAEHAAAEPTNGVFKSSYPALEKYRGSYTPLDLDADTVAPMQGALESYLSERGAFADKQDEWYAEGMQLEIDAKRECCEILSTAEILQDWRKTGFVKAWDCADRVYKACMILAPGMKRADADRDAEARRLEMNDFLDRWTVCNNLTRPEVEKRAAELERKKTELHFEIVGEYNGAYDKLDASLDALPSYVKSQTMCISGPVITEKSELAQRFLARGATGTVKEALAVRDELDNFANNYRTAKNKVRAAERRIHAFEAMYGTFDDFVPQPPKAENRSGAPQKAASVAAFTRRTISDEKQKYVSPLLALERDFKNYTYAHCTMLDQLGELNVNKELYSTNVLEDATQDPYVRTAYAARCLSAAPKPGYYTTSASIVMPGYYVGYGKTPYEIAMLEASDRNRGTCSYTYFIAGYAAAAGNVVSDPFDNYIKPLLDEIDAARAAAGPHTLTAKSSSTKYGSVSGSGTYTFGTKVTLKAKAKSGYAFAGWYTDKACTKKLNPKGYDNREPKIKYTMPAKKTTIYAKFVTKAEDKKALKFSKSTAKLAKTPKSFVAGEAMSLKLGFASSSLPTVTSKGLPAGMSIDKATGEITGTPTKPGSYVAKVAVKSAAGNKITQDVKINVTAPSWAYGTFYGYGAVIVKGKAVPVSAKFTSTEVGKVSGKVTYKGKAAAFTASYASATARESRFTVKFSIGGTVYKSAMSITKENDGFDYARAHALDEDAFELEMQKPVALVRKGKTLAAMVGRKYTFTKDSKNAGLTKKGDKLVVKFADKDVVKVAGIVGGKKFTGYSAPVMAHGKLVKGGKTAYVMDVPVVEATTKYYRLLTFKVTIDSKKKVTKVSKAFTKIE